jgi:uncharacterized phage-associated protein
LGDKESLENLERRVKNQKISNIMVTRSNLKNLNIQPLSVAKYFYEKGIQDYRLMQDLIYLTYREVLKKENKVLFKEKFQAWDGGPMLESVYRQMDHHFEEHGQIDYLFDKVEDLTNKEVKPYLTKTYRDYQTAKKQGKELEFIFQPEDEAWEQAREKVNGEIMPHIFLEPTKIIALVK